MNAAEILRAEAAKRIIIKDGAYGTLIQERRLDSADYCAGLDLIKDQRGNNDLLNITQPEVVRSICESFADAGAEILATNTFNGNAISQADYAAEALVTHINLASARIVREVADSYSAKDGKQRWVAGALGPTNKTLSLSPNVNDPAYREVDFDQVKAVYREQIDALVEGGVDFILVETIFDTLNAKAAIMATLEAEQALGRALPLMISMTLTDLSGRNLSGHTVEAFWASVRHVLSADRCSKAGKGIRRFNREVGAERELRAAIEDRLPRIGASEAVGPKAGFRHQPVARLVRRLHRGDDPSRCEPRNVRRIGDLEMLNSPTPLGTVRLR